MVAHALGLHTQQQGGATATVGRRHSTSPSARTPTW